MNINFYKRIGSLFIILALVQVAFAQSSSDSYRITDSVLDSQGGESSSDSFKLRGSIPYISPTETTSTSYTIKLGFQNGGEVFIPPVLSGTAIVAGASLSWIAADGIIGIPSYQVGVSAGSGGPYTYYDSTTSLGANITNLSFASTYFFVVKTTEADGDELEELSNEISIVPRATSQPSDSGGGGGGGSSLVNPVTGSPGVPPGVYYPVDPVTTEPQPTEVISGGLASVIDNIIDFFTPPRTTIPNLELVVPKVAPQALSSNWTLLSQGPLNELVLKPLPSELRNLVNEIPQLNKLFREVGITNFQDLQKLRNVSLSVPGLTDALGLPKITVDGDGIGALRDIRVSELSSDLKESFPQGVLFAQLANGAIDVKPQLRIDSSGSSNQIIHTLVDNTIVFSIKPKASARSVYGYLVLNSKQVGFSLIPRANAQTTLVVDEFEFLDEDNDGIYTTAVSMPTVPGNYEVITLIEYEDVELGTQTIRMLTVVDPEGYIYESLSGKEVRIPGAVVTLDYLNGDSYVKWPADKYQQINPQITDLTGQYSFLVPPGWYQLKIQAPGYKAYEGRAFEVREGVGVHENIELKSHTSIFNFFDWKTVLLVLVVGLLLVNFYRDKLRENKEKILMQRLK